MPRPVRMPKRLPTGTRYVVEGRATANGRFRVSARYLVYPDGHRIDVAGEAVLPISCCGSKGATCAKDVAAKDVAATCANAKDAKRARRPARRSTEIALQLGA